MPEFTPADITALKGRGGKVNFHDQQIDLPADHALKGFDDVQRFRHVYVQEEKLERNIYMHKGKGHGVAANDPAAMANEVFMTGRGVGEVCGKKPDNSHGRKAISGNGAWCVFKGQRHNSEGANHAAPHIPLASGAMHFWVSLTRGLIQQKRAGCDSGKGRSNMQQEQGIVQEKPFGEKLRSHRGVTVKMCVGQIEKRNNEHHHRGRCDGFQEGRHAPVAAKYSVEIIESSSKRVHAGILHSVHENSNLIFK